MLTSVFNAIPIEQRGGADCPARGFQIKQFLEEWFYLFWFDPFHSFPRAANYKLMPKVDQKKTAQPTIPTEDEEEQDAQEDEDEQDEEEVFTCLSSSRSTGSSSSNSSGWRSRKVVAV